jgi:hypothetical protein
MRLLDDVRAGVPAPPDSPANVPGDPVEPPGPEEPLLPGGPEAPERDGDEDDTGDESG